jgi:hypothetical protein
MVQVLGALQNVEIDVTGGTSFKDLVCLSTSSINGTADSSSTQTNCGVLTSVGFPQMTLNFDAICKTDPDAGTEISYNSLLQAFNNKTLVNVLVQNPVVTGSSAGAAYYHQFLGYITSLTWTQSTTEFISFSGTIVSSGEIDVVV